MNEFFTIIGVLASLVIIVVSLIGVLRISNSSVIKKRWIGLIIITISYLVINLVASFISIDYSPKDDLQQFSLGFITFMKSIINTINLFNSKESLSSFSSTLVENPIFITFYYLLNFISILIWATSFLASISLRVSNFIKVNLGTIFSTRDIHIFSEINKRSEIMAKDIIKKNKSSHIIFITKLDSDAEIRAANRLNRSGYSIKNINDNSNKEILLRIGLNSNLKSKHIYFYLLNEDDVVNLTFAEKNNLLNYNEETINGFYGSNSKFNLKREFIFKNRLHVFIRLENRLEIELSNYQNVNIVYESELTAAQLINVSPLHLLIDQTKIINGNPQISKNNNIKLNIASIGFGKTGEETFKKLYTDGQNIGIDYKFSIFDLNAKDREGIFFNRYPFLIGKNINFIQTSSHSDALFSNLYNSLSKEYFNYIIICLGSDKHNCEIANRIALFYMKNNLKVTIVVHIRDEDNGILLYKSNNLVSIEKFGILNDMYNVKNIIQENNFAYAKLCNFLYNNLYSKNHMLLKCKIKNGLFIQYKEEIIFDKSINHELLMYLENKKIDENITQSKIESKWEETIPFEKKSSLWVAENIAHKIYMIGDNFDALYAYLNNDSYINDNTNSKIKSNMMELIKNLAYSEHLRWVAFMAISGFTNYDNDVVIERKCMKSKKHMCMTDWDGLRDIGLKFKQNFYLLDHIHSILAVYLQKNSINDEAAINNDKKVIDIGIAGRTYFNEISTDSKDKIKTKDFVRLKNIVKNYYSDMYKKNKAIKIFSCLADGFDLLCIELAIDMGFEVFAILPTNYQKYLSATKFPGSLNKIFKYEKLKIIKIDDETWNDGDYTKLSEHLIKYSDYLLIYDDGNSSNPKGGTKWVVENAVKNSKNIKNIYQDLI